MLEVQLHSTVYMSARDLNSGPHVCLGSVSHFSYDQILVMKQFNSECCLGLQFERVAVTVGGGNHCGRSVRPLVIEIARKQRAVKPCILLMLPFYSAGDHRP